MSIELQNKSGSFNNVYDVEKATSLKKYKI